MQTLICRRSQPRVDRCEQVNSLKKQRDAAGFGLFAVPFGHAARHLQQRNGLRILAHQQVPEVVVEPSDKGLSGEAFAQYTIE